LAASLKAGQGPAFEQPGGCAWAAVSALKFFMGET